MSGAEDLSAWVGRTTSRPLWIDPDQANRMAATLDRETDFKGGDPLPPAWHWLYVHDIVRAGQLGEEGHPALGVVMPPVPLPRRMWAGGRLEFRRPVVLGTTVERRSTIASVTPKTGSTGPLWFVSVHTEVVSGGEVAVAEEQTVVYREMDPTASLPQPAAAPTDATEKRTWHLDSTALFRYSALTFNGHRIHYDADYCREVEGYPDLVVHGPLLATLLCDLAHRPGRRLATFRYRARSPVFLPHGFTVNARDEGADGLELWAATDTGGLAMQAQARVVLDTN